MEREVEILLNDWARRVRESQCAHYECGKVYGRINRIFGIPTIVLSAVVGTTVFATLDNAATGRTKLLLGLLSVTAAVLASLQTFMSFSERADKHRIMGSKYGSIRRELELLKTFPSKSEEDLQRKVESIKSSLDDLAENSPHIPSSLKARVDAALKGRSASVVFNMQEPSLPPPNPQ